MNLTADGRATGPIAQSASLESGKSRVMEFNVLARFPRPGEYTIRLSFTPTPDPKLIINKEIKVQCDELKADSMIDKVQLSAPKRPLLPGSEDEVIRLMNVKTSDGHRLLFAKDPKGESIKMVERLVKLDSDSRLVAVRKVLDPDVLNQQVWVTYNKGAELHLLIIEVVTGAIVEQKGLSKKLQAQDQ